MKAGLAYIVMTTLQTIEFVSAALSGKDSADIRISNADGYEAALEKIRSSSAPIGPVIVIIDLFLRPIDGLKLVYGPLVAKALEAKFSQIPFVILVPDEEAMNWSFVSGIDISRFINMSSETAENDLFLAVEAAFNGWSPLPESQA